MTTWEALESGLSPSDCVPLNIANAARYEMKIRGMVMKITNVSSHEPVIQTTNATTTDTTASTTIPSLMPVPC